MTKLLLEYPIKKYQYFLLNFIYRNEKKFQTDTKRK